MGKPKTPKTTPPPPPVTTTGQDVAQAQKDQRRRERGRYSFDRTLLAPVEAAINERMGNGSKSTLG